MKITSNFLTLFLMIVLGLSAFVYTYSLFSDTSTSTNNILSASDSFPSSTPANTPTPTATTTNTPTPTPTTIQAGDVVINEINWMGSTASTSDEWIELRNMKSYPIDLSGWYIDSLGAGSASITINTGTIPANGYFLLAHYNEEVSRINVIPDFTSLSIELSNGGEQLRLKTPGGAVIDTANGSSTWLAGSNDAPKKSMERKDPPGDGTSNGKWKAAGDHNGMDGTGTSDEFGSPKNTNSI